MMGCFPYKVLASILTKKAKKQVSEAVLKILKKTHRKCLHWNLFFDRTPVKKGFIYMLSLALS